MTTTEGTAMDTAVDAMQEQISRLEERVAVLLEQLDSSKVSADDAEKAYRDYRVKVAEVATRHAQNNNWCSTIDSALEELDLQRMGAPFSATLLVRVNIQSVLPRTMGNPTALRIEGILGGLDDIREAIKNTLTVDDGEQELEVGAVSFAVSDVERRSS